MRRNVRLYPYFQFFVSGMAWLPVFFLYFSSVLSFKEVILLESVYYFSVVLLEVPSGYFSDTIGRKQTLLISTIAFCTSYLLFSISGSFLFFAIAQFLLAAGMAFLSGTDTVLHFESLKVINEEADYGALEAKSYRAALIGGGLAALIGGILGSHNLAAAYLFSFVTASIAFIIVMQFVEPKLEEELRKKETIKVSKQLGIVFNYIKSSPLNWIFGFVLLQYILGHVPYEFYQPILKILENEGRLFTFADAAITSGILYACTRFIGAWAAGNSIKWRDRFGLKKLLLISALTLISIIGIMSQLLHPVLVFIILFRNIPMAITSAPLNAEISPRINEQQRATYFSMQSLICRLGFATSLIVFSFLAPKESMLSWETLSRILVITFFSGAIAIFILFVLFNSFNNNKLSN